MRIFPQTGLPVFRGFLVLSKGCMRGPHDFAFVSGLAFPGLVILHLSPTCLPLWMLWAVWYYTGLPLVSPYDFRLALVSLGRMSIMSSTCLPFGPHDLHLSPIRLIFWVLWAACFCSCFRLVSPLVSPAVSPLVSPLVFRYAHYAVGAVGPMLPCLSPTCSRLFSTCRSLVFQYTVFCSCGALLWWLCMALVFLCLLGVHAGKKVFWSLKFTTCYYKYHHVALDGVNMRADGKRCP